MSETILELFESNSRKFGPRCCFRFKENGAWHSLSWTQAVEKIESLATGLKQLGIQKGERIAIFSGSSVYWTLSDLAILWCGGITVPIYQSETAAQVRFILQDSNTKIVFVQGGKPFEIIFSLLPELPQIQKVVLMARNNPSPHEKILSLEELETLSEKRTHRIPVEPADIATIVYTSGTTGIPKGVVLTHQNILAETEACARILPVSPKDESLLFLPLAHILARAIQFLQLRVGFIHAYAESVEKVSENFKEIRPHFIVTVPRIFEKAFEKIHARLGAKGSIKQALFYGALSVGEARPKGILGHFKIFLAEKLVFKKIREAFGGRLRFAISGGAALSEELGKFFKTIGIPIYNGYGLTETTAAINCNSPGNFHCGTVGKPIWGVSEKIAPDGEILAKGEMIFKEYFNNKEETLAAFDEQGWFKTGDIGYFNSEGHLIITDRKKDLIVTAAGKNIAPQKIENLFKGDPLINQIVVLGDGRKHLAALVTLHRKEMMTEPGIREKVWKRIEEKNRELASFESIKKFTLLEEEFSLEKGELTQTLKIKRKMIGEKYKDVIEKMYQE
ncbi:MAG: long-chain fatty acid--CoA ligase [bacterium]|nr:long-chain fatty acid--CoA ligase [bacterium]